MKGNKYDPVREIKERKVGRKKGRRKRKMKGNSGKEKNMYVLAHFFFFRNRKFGIKMRTYYRECN